MAIEKMRVGGFFDNLKIVFKQINLVQTSKIVVTNFSKITIINTQKIMSNFMKDWNN